MRPEEQHVAESLVAFLGDTEFEIVGVVDDPPDFLLTKGDWSVGVEVSRLTPTTLDENGVEGNRISEDEVALGLIEYLDRRVGSEVDPKISLLLKVVAPITDRKFRLGLADFVQEHSTGRSVGHRSASEITGTEVELLVVPRRESGQAIVGMVSNKNAILEVDVQIEWMLHKQISTKTKKCEGITGEIWLALLNNYPNAKLDDYRRVEPKIELNHSFSRIFVVDSGGEVVELSL